MNQSTTKARVLAGREHRETVPLRELGDDVSITLRPVTDTEAAEAQANFLSSLDLPEGVDVNSLKDGSLDMSLIDIGKVTIGQLLVDHALVAAAIVPAAGDEPWTPKDVGQLPPGVPSRLAAVVRRISGLSKEGEADAEGFRPQ